MVTILLINIESFRNWFAYLYFKLVSSLPVLRLYLLYYILALPRGEGCPPCKYRLVMYSILYFIIGDLQLIQILEVLQGNPIIQAILPLYTEFPYFVVCWQHTVPFIVVYKATFSLIESLFVRWFMIFPSIIAYVPLRQLVKIYF